MATTVRGWSGPLTALRRAAARRLGGHDLRFLGGLLLASLAVAGMVFLWPGTWPISLMVLPMLAASLLLSPRVLPWYVIATLAMTVVALVNQADAEQAAPILLVRVLVVFGTALFILVVSFRRSRLGVAGVRGESMFLDLRDRIMRQSGLPPLPPGWLLQYDHRSAGGTPFSGDFAVGFRSGELLQLVVVDVSGKGEEAGTRALQLIGALGGLMGALEPHRFLAAANEYLVRQDWSEGFATAVHLAIDLRTGDFEVRSAGHPPPVRLSSGSGRWLVLDTGGPALGLLAGSEYPPTRGTLARGDIVLLYTDGLVESSSRELGLGIDRLLGHAERELHGDLERGAVRLVNRLGSTDDDSALLLLHRR